MSSNPTLEQNGFDSTGQRPAIANTPDSDFISQFPQQSTPYQMQDIQVANNTFRAWRHGARVSNGAGFFCAPPPVQNPQKNSDYLRMFVDSSFTNGTQLGYGIVSLPISDELWFEATGDQPTDGNLIMKLRGPHSVGSNNTGIVDLFSVLIFTQASGSPSAIESSGLFDFDGASYWNTTSKTIRVYDGSAWGDVGGGGGVTAVGVVGSHSTGGSSTQTFSHVLGTTPTTIEVTATNADGQTNSSTGAWDSILGNSCVYVGGNAGSTAAACIYIDQGGGNTVSATIGTVTSTQFTVTWSNGGSPTGTIYLRFQSMA